MQPYIYTTHGGLITYIKSALKVTILNVVYQQSDHWVAMFFSIDTLNKSVVIGNVCRPPRELNEALTYFLTNLTEQYNIRMPRVRKSFCQEILTLIC